MIKKRILILGAGFGGLEAATLLAPRGYDVTMIDEADGFAIGFTKFDLMLGVRTYGQIVDRYETLREKGAKFVRDTITSIDTDRRKVSCKGGDFGYERLIVALGASIDPGSTPGFKESGGHEFYSVRGAEALAPVLADFKRGTILVSILGLPYKCPPAPFEAAFLLHEHYLERGCREDITIKVTVPMPAAVPISPQVSATIVGLLAERDIETLTGFEVARVDAGAKALNAIDGRAVPYDLLLGIPRHRPPSVVANSSLSKSGGFIMVDPMNLRTAIPDVFAVGDVVHLPVGPGAMPKTGVAAETGAMSAVANILHEDGLEPEPDRYTGYGCGYFEFGGQRIARMCIDFFGGPAPVVHLDGPRTELRVDKDQWEASRRDRWFVRTD